MKYLVLLDVEIKLYVSCGVYFTTIKVNKYMGDPVSTCQPGL